MRIAALILGVLGGAFSLYCILLLASIVEREVGFFQLLQPIVGIVGASVVFSNRRVAAAMLGLSGIGALFATGLNADGSALAAIPLLAAAVVAWLASELATERETGGRSEPPLDRV